MAWGCLLGFNALLRTGELLSLLLSNCSWTPQGLVLHLTDTKGAQRRLIQEKSVMVLDELTLGMVRLLSRKKSPGDYLVGISDATFRTRWNHMKQCLHLQHLRFLPYSLRRGGATWFFKETGSFSRTMLRGRWQHLKTCKLYISEAQTALANLSLPPNLYRPMPYWLGPTLLGGPPSDAWKTLRLEGWTCSSVAGRCLRVLLAGMPAEWSGMAWVWCDQTCCESERPLSFTKLRRVPVGKKKERSCELMHV